MCLAPRSAPIPSVNLTMVAYPGTFRYRAGKRSAFLQKASSVLHDLEAMQKALGVENRKLRNGRKRAAAALVRQKL